MIDALFLAFSTQIATRADTIAVAVLALLGYCGMWLVAKVRLAAQAAATAVEIQSASNSKLRGDKKMETAVDLALTQLGNVGIVVTKSAIKSFIRRQLTQVSANVAASISPPPPVDATALTQLAIPKRSGTSTDRFRAVLEGTMPDLHRPSGEVETIPEFDLPKDRATLEDET